MTEAELRDAISRHSLDAYADEIMARAAPAFSMRAVQLAGGRDPEPGASRFGGEPDMPPGAEWPTKQGAPLAFLGQIRLSDVPAGPERDSLPDSGRLLLFYDVRDGGPWGFDPADAGGWAVLYEPDETDHTRTPLPQALLNLMAENFGDPEPFTPSPLKFEPTITLPGHETLAIELSEEADEGYSELLEELGGESDEEASAPIHQLLGHAAEVQGDMASECQLVSNGIYLGGDKPIDEARVKALEPGAADWRLLLQIDTDEEGPDWMWGDCGRLYFWIRREDLARRDFSGVWVVLQCS
jgi:uncharacterized protein YwqG